jgi:hypothetical protein
LSVLWCTDSEYLFGILWPLCYLSFDVRILSTRLVSCNHCVICPLMYGFWVNTMATRYQMGTQNPYIKGQITQWLQDTKRVLRIRTSKDRQHNGHKIPNGYSESVHQRTDNTMAFDVRILSTHLVSCGHCVVCPLMYGFWVPLWYLVTIVLSVLSCTDSEYPFGNPYIKGQTTQWPQDTKGVLRIRTSKDRQHNGHKIPKGYSESVHQRTDNTMARRYPPLVSCSHCVVCPLMYGFWVPIWYLVAIVLSVLWCTDSEYTKGVLRIRTSKDRQHNGHKIPKGYLEFVYQRTDNTMATICQMGTQNPYIKGQTTQWPHDTKGVLRIPRV